MIAMRRAAERGVDVAERRPAPSVDAPPRPAPTCRSAAVSSTAPGDQRQRSVDHARSHRVRASSSRRRDAGCRSGSCVVSWPAQRSENEDRGDLLVRSEPRPGSSSWIAEQRARRRRRRARSALRRDERAQGAAVGAPSLRGVLELLARAAGRPHAERCARPAAPLPRSRGQSGDSGPALQRSTIDRCAGGGNVLRGDDGSTARRASLRRRAARRSSPGRGGAIAASSCGGGRRARIARVEVAQGGAVSAVDADTIAAARRAARGRGTIRVALGAAPVARVRARRRGGERLAVGRGDTRRRPGQGRRDRRLATRGSDRSTPPRRSLSAGQAVTLRGRTDPALAGAFVDFEAIGRRSRSPRSRWRRRDVRRDVDRAPLRAVHAPRPRARRTRRERHRLPARALPGLGPRLNDDGPRIPGPVGDITSRLGSAIKHVPSASRYATSRSFCASARLWSFLSDWFSIWRMRSRVTLNVRPTSSSVRGCSPPSP